MIVLDTHVWISHVQDSQRLGAEQQRIIEQNEDSGIGVCAISLWEISKAVELGRLSFSVPLEDWFAIALSYPGISLLPLTPRIAVESTRLPGSFHRDPADQLIVATARVLDCPVVTRDSKILSYTHVKLLP